MVNCLSYLIAINTTAPDQPALERAAALAMENGASLTAFACCYLDRKEMLHFNSRQDAKYEARSELEQRLRHQVAKLGLAADVNYEAAWNEDFLKAACQRAQHPDVCMMFLDRSYQEDLPRWLESSPCPLYLASSEVRVPDGPILAAIDPRSRDELHDGLNHNVLATASNLAEDLHRELSLVCALDEKESIATHLGFDYLSELTAEQSAIAQRFALDPSRVHLQIGRPCTVIYQRALQLEAAVLVMGTSREKSLYNTLVGCKVERLMEHYNGDLLVVT
ncbi:universal stress protein [Porticoccus sp.]|nr:MAG: hypothetical protein EP324_03015 [Gammaproteobacteria bacterium]